MIGQLSAKQKLALTWWNRQETAQADALICDGAVRSGKTFAMSLGFVLWAMCRFNQMDFALCGKTIGSVRRNLVTPLLRHLREMGFMTAEKISAHYFEVAVLDRVNRFYLFGGRDEGAAALIQGMTLGGVLFDEVALMPRSFVEQALARCSQPGAKFWFNCNPDAPTHWFYREWICQKTQKNALHLHFTMADNPALSPAVRRRYERIYTGRFYERYVEGRWTAQTGQIYDLPAAAIFREAVPCSRYYISCDYGTVNPMAMQLWGIHDNGFYLLREYYYDSRRTGARCTDTEYYAALEGLAGGMTIEEVIVDPAAAGFIETVRRAGVYRVRPAVNAVLPGIQACSRLMQEGRIHIHADCADTLREFGLYRWKEEALTDTPVKENDHAMDAMRYFISTIADRPADDFFVGSIPHGVSI